MGVRTLLVVAALATAAFAPRLAGAGSITPMPASLTFPATGTGAMSMALTVQLTNTSMVAVNLNSVALGGTNPGDYTFVPSVNLPILLLPGVGIGVDVTFVPTAPGLRTALLQATVAGQMGTTDVPLDGKGLGPKAVILPSPISCGGLPFGKPVAPVSVTASNGGGAKLTISSVSLSGPDAALFSLTGLPGFPQPLGPGGKFVFSMSFTPVKPAQANAVLSVVSDDPMTPNLMVPITCLSGDPKIALDLGTIIFGTQRVNQTALPQEVNISNPGLSDLHVASITVNGANANDFMITAKPNLPATIPVGTMQKFTVSFTPLAGGMRTAAVQINSDDPMKPQKILQMSGVGTTPGAMVAPAMLSFAQVRVGLTSSQSVTITNTGTGPVLVSTLSITGMGAAAFTSNLAQPFLVAPMSSTPLQITFKPTLVAAQMATLTIGTDDPNLPMFTVPLTGSGSTPKFGIMPVVLDFGGINVGKTSPPQSFQISNTGNAPLTIKSFTVAGPSSSLYMVAPLVKPGTIVKMGDTMTFSVVYAPQNPANDDAVVNIAVDDPSNMQGMVVLKGSGQQAAMMVTPMDMDTLDFGMAPVGGVKQLPVRINNTGSAPLVIAGLKFTDMAMPTAFSADQMPPFTIAEQKTLTLMVSFKPTMATISMASMEIDPDDAAIMPVTINLTGTGISPMISTSPAMTLDFGSVAVGTSSQPLEIRVFNLAMKIQVFTEAKSDDAHFSVDNTMFNKNIAAGATSSVFVTFTPDAPGAVVTGRVKFLLASAPGTPAATVLVTGTGVAGADAGTGPVPNRGGCSVGPSRAGETPTQLGGLVGLGALGLALLITRSTRRSRRRRAG